MEEEGKEDKGTGRWRNERVRGEEEEGEADLGERSCFYSLSFLAEAKDVLSTDGVYQVGQTDFYCILLHVDACVQTRHCCYCKSISTTVIYNAQTAKWRMCAHTIGGCSGIRTSAQTLCHGDAEIITPATGVFNFWRKLKEVAGSANRQIDKGRLNWELRGNVQTAEICTLGGKDAHWCRGLGRAQLSQLFRPLQFLCIV